MSELVLARLWEDVFRKEVATGWIYPTPVGGAGMEFQVSPDHPIAVYLTSMRVKTLSLLLTLYSTEELIWAVESWRSSIYGDVTVYLQPYRQYVRGGLRSDDYLVKLWLESEKRWKAEDTETQLRGAVKIAKQSLRVGSLVGRDSALNNLVAVAEKHLAAK